MLTRIPKFRRCVIQNFPFIEEDFDALTDYELLCKVVEYLNKVIDNENDQSAVIEEYTEDFLELKNFVDTYFDNLDVQEEINNKLDEMAENGTLGQYFQQFVDPVLTSFELEMNEKIETGDSTLNNKIDSTEASLDAKIDTNVGTLQSQISGLASGSPLTASSTSGMTDTTKIYVNTTDGKWYYYNGSSWVAGGTYQSSGIADGSVGLDNLKTGISKFNLYEPRARLNDAHTRIQVVDRPYFRKDSVLEFDIPEGFQWTIVRNVYEPSYSYETVLNWTASTTKYTVAADGRFDITFRKTGDLELSDADIATCLSALKCYRIVSNNAGSLLEYYPGRSTAFTLTEHYTANGNSNNIHIVSNSTASAAAFYVMFENLVEYTNTRGWSADGTTHHNFQYLKYNLGDYGTAIETSASGYNISQLDIVIPANYALVINTVSGTMSVKLYTRTNPDDAILVRNSNGYCGGGAFQTMVEGEAIRQNTSDIADLRTSVSALSTAGNFDDIVKGINHRGWNTTAPENTIPAYQESKKHGFKYVETDISWTADGVPVLLHDDTIDRTSNGSGSIGSLTYDQVSQYDFGSWKDPAYAGTQIPTLDTFLVLCRNLGLHPYLELKNSQSPTEAMIQEVVDKVEENGMKGNVTYISFDKTLLGYVKDYDSKARLGFLPPTDTITQTYIDYAVALKTGDNEVFLDPDNSNVTSDVITMCQTANLPLEVWTVNNTQTILAMDPYITGITSDSLIAGKVLYEGSIE